jgi:hypothetical protein
MWNGNQFYFILLKHLKELGLKLKLARNREISNVGYGEMQIIGENLVLQL